MFSNFGEAQKYVVNQGVRMIDLKFSDLTGRWHHVTVPSSQFDESVMELGVAFDGSAVGLKSIKSGDMVLIPDLSTAFVDPFWEEITLSMICSAHEADTREPFAHDPRNIARNAEEYMKSLGIADESRWGPEYEFYVFDNVAFENDVNTASYRVDSREADWHSAAGGHGHLIPIHGGYHAIPPKDQIYNLRTEILPAPGNHGRSGQVPPSRSRRTGPERDRDTHDETDARRGRHTNREVRHQNGGASQRPDRHVHAETAVR
ncbi:MAG TPA: glutamine synthetase beta-grasp domain-containing protein [Acidobacteriota bacterium]|nr:glutamine synthetase beta-grasp domain-containing protein [Acidobacteriota bacterium]